MFEREKFCKLVLRNEKGEQFTMLDSHCHLNDSQYQGQVDEIVNNFLCAGVEKVICVGCDETSNEKAKEIAGDYKQVFYTVGIHPDDCETYNEQKLERYLKQRDNKLVAIGEIGLDYFHNSDNKETQKRVFISQIELAKKYKLPIVVHCRDAYGDTLDILKSCADFSLGVVLHCFSGSLEFANEIIKLGGKISFTGSVTFKNAHNLHRVAQSIPLDSFFVETDSPYLTPEPNRGKRNEPKNVKDVIRFIANLRNTTFAEIETQTDKNAKKFFHLN